MKKAFLAACLLVLPAAAPAQQMEPGEWQFVSTVTSPMIPQAKTASFTQCVTLDQARDPERWMGQQFQGDCTATPGKKAPGSYRYQVSCPQSRMSGTVAVRYSAETIETDMQMSGEMQGRKFEMRNQMSGRRVGPCQR